MAPTEQTAYALPKSNASSTDGSNAQLEGADMNKQSPSMEKGGADMEKGGSGSMTADERTQLELRESKYLSGKKLALVFIGMLLSVFLIALDQTILAPAIPIIASEFQALDQIAWIASAYFLTQAAFLLLYGQALTVFDRKWTFLFAITLFEVGSIICAAAPNVNTLIFGRAFAGVGAAGIFVSCLSIIADVTRLEQRPKLLGLFGGVFAISSVIGPLLGGAFTDKITWRLCFWINVPFGAVTITAVSFILGASPAPPMNEDVALYTESKIARWSFGRWNPSRQSIGFRLALLDWTGAIVMLGIITCLLLPLQWGGNKYAWNSGVIIGTFVAFAVLVIVFVLYEWKMAGPSAILPLRLLKNRTQVGATLEAFFVMFVLLLGTYFLPIYFQAAQGVSSTQSGISILPFMLGIVFSAGLGGFGVSKIGYYKPFLVFAPWLMCIGSGLLYTITPDTSNARLVGYQIITALGVGAVMQNTIISVQADIENEDDVPQATGVVTFGQLVGGTIGIAIASTIFATQLASGLAQYAPDAPALVRNSVTEIAKLPIEQQAGVIQAYVFALNKVYVIGVGAGVCASLSGMLVRNGSVKGKDLMGGGA